MKTIRLHLPSVAVGGGLALLLTLTLGFAQTTRPTPPAAQGPTPQLVAGMQGRPAARDIVFLSQGDPIYTVPQGRFLVITGVGTRTPQDGTGIRIGRVGVVIDGAVEYFNIPNTGLMFGLTAGRALPGGTTVELPLGPTGQGILSGYLEDA